MKARKVDSHSFTVGILTPSRVCRHHAIHALLTIAGLLLGIEAQAQNPLWDTVTWGSGGFSFADRDLWRDTEGEFASIEEARQAAYDFCKGTLDYDNLTLDCTDHPIFDDSLTGPYKGIPGNSNVWYYAFQVNMYRNNGLHGTLMVHWYVNVTDESDCPSGQLIGPDSHSCVDPANHLEPEQLSGLMCGSNESNPCDPASGNKFQTVRDVSMQADGGLEFVRYYNSMGPYRSWAALAPGWRHTYSRAINERPDIRPKVLVASASESATYTATADACADGWDDIKATAFGGELSAATATFAGGNICKIQSGGNTVAIVPVRVRHQWFSYAAPANLKTVTRPNGGAIVFELIGGNWVAELNPTASLEQVGSNWVFTDQNDTKETYNSSGRLSSIQYRNGRTETLTYNATTGYLTQVTGQFGHKLTFSYQADGHLAEVQSGSTSTEFRYYSNGTLKDVEYPFNKYETYVYEDPDLPYHLTGIIDENSDRYSTWAYDDAGRAVSSEHGSGTELVEFEYNSDGTTTLTLGGGASRTYDFSVQQGNQKIEQVTGDVCSTCPGGSIASRTYDTNGYLYDATDWNGNVTQTSRDSEGRTTQLVEAYGTSDARTTNTTWHSTYRLPTQVSTAKNDTNYVYDANGNPTSVTITDGTDTRTWTMTYNSYGQVLTINGPRTDLSDVTTLTYHTGSTGNQSGQLKTMTNALGQITYFDWYDYAGRITKIRDANGLTIRPYYNYRGNVTKIEHIPTSGTTRTTLFTYDNAEQLLTATFPDGRVLTYDYDDAHYLTSITDNSGNSIEYDYDAMGNLKDEDTYNPSSVLSRSVDYLYDLNNRLAQISDAGIYSTEFEFDDIGNLVEVTDPDLQSTQHVYDALNRLTQTEDALTGLTDLVYDVHDNLIAVTAPNAASTTFEYNDLDDLTEEASPDRGTITYTHDAAGNIVTMTDARGKDTAYTYDALNRLTEIELDNSDTITFQYDTGTHAKGRLNKIVDPSGETSWTYNNFGDVTSKSQKIGSITLTTSYGYDTAGRPTSITLPSGKVVTYGYTNEKPISVTVDSTTILSGATYAPFGPVNGWTWGNSTSHSRTFDTRGLLTSQSMVTDSRTLTYDDVGRPFTLDDSRHDLGFDYNVLGQITDFTAAGSAPLTAQDYSYDANGNRETLVQSSTTYNYSTTAYTNRLASTTGPTAKSYTYDAAGNVTADGIHSYGYDDRGRLVNVDSGSVTYEHNGQGQRVKKDDGSSVTLFVYDEDGHLVGEYGGTGSPIREHVWFNGAPVAVLVGSNKYYVHTDHLGTPRIVTNGNTTIWRWESGPFGEEAAQEDPDGDSTDFAYNLRFPGQYFDDETGLHYNYYRTYDPSTGRYLESDPIGLIGGLNTFGYVGANPVFFYDPYGLFGVDDVFGGIYYVTGGWNPSQGFVNFSAGLGDALLLGQGQRLRDLADVGASVDKCSGAYDYGSYAALLLGGARLTYAGLAKGGSLLASSGAQASAFRESLRTFFRGGIGKKWRPADLGGKTDAELLVSAGKTNGYINAYGAGVLAAGAVDAAECGCGQ